MMGAVPSWPLHLCIREWQEGQVEIGAREAIERDHVGDGLIAWELPRESICQKAGEGVDLTVVHEAKADTVIGAEAVHADLVEEAAHLGCFERPLVPLRCRLMMLIEPRP